MSAQSWTDRTEPDQDPVVMWPVQALVSVGLNTDEEIVPMVPCVSDLHTLFFSGSDDVEVIFFLPAALIESGRRVGAGGHAALAVQPGDKISLKSCPRAAAGWFIPG